MKKLIIALCAVLALSCFSAAAEEAFKVILWEHDTIDADEAGNPIEVPVKVTLTLDQPVEIDEMESQVNDGFFAVVRREGVTPVTVAITPADFGPHANLNDATEEQLNLFMDVVAEQYDETAVIKEVRKSKYDNVYLCAGVPSSYSIWMVYEDTIIEIIQYSEDGSDLKPEDQNFAVEVLQGIWME